MKKLDSFKKAPLIMCAFILSGCSLSPGNTATEKQLSVVDNKNGEYQVGDVFDNLLFNGGMDVYVIYNDNTSTQLKKTDFSYTVEFKNNPFDATKAFEDTGSYKVSFSRNDLAPVTKVFDVVPKSVDPTKAELTGISVSGYTSEVTVNSSYTFDGVVTATYSNGKTENVTSKAQFDYPSTAKAGTYSVGVSYTENNITKRTSFDLVVKESGSPILSGISVSGQKTTFTVGDTFTFGGTVTATYSNSSTANVTSQSTFSGYDLSKTGKQTVTVTYNGKTTTYQITVNPKAGYETITVQEAVSIIDSLDMNVISDKEYYIRGVCTNVELDTYGFNGGFLNSNLKFRSVLKNNVASTVDDIDGKEIVICGYLENYNSNYQIPYLPANVSPTGVKYNAKLIEVVSGGGEEETIDVTNISVSPINKTLKVNETYTLSATILPSNASDKSVIWTSSDSNICSVSSDGLIKGLKVGNATITAKTSNNLTATCNVTVKTEDIDPVEGNKYEIEFNKFESDGQTELTSSTIVEQITKGSSYISSFTLLSKVYKGTGGLKFGSSKTGGELAFELASSLKSVPCSEIIVDVAQYGTKSTTVSVYADDATLISGSSSDSQIVAKISNPKQIEEVKITTSSRAYISKITLVCGEITPIPVTAISIPSSKSISLGNSEQLAVTYTPSNANTGKSITWKSSDTRIATISNGEVNGISVGTAIITATSEGGFTSSCSVTVSEIAITGVSLSSTAETISIGGTKQLTATIEPSNASSKTLTWSSSNTTVTTVSSTGLVSAKAVGTSTITVKTNNNKQATCVITVTEQTKDAWTILIYMCGADLESENGFATGDIKEILSVSNQPDDVNIVIETGGSKSWSLGSSYLSGATKIDSSKLQRWHVENKKLTFDESLSTYTSMGSSSTLQSFVEYGINKYPAEKTGVIFWNHGGAMYGCCYDEKKNDDSLTNSEMKSAFSKALINTGSSKLEFVGYDTCLTQVQDIAEFNSNYFNYMIASEESEAGYGWDYDTWVDDLYAKKPTETILKAVVDGFITDNGGVNSTRSDQTLSYLDLSQMPAYKSAFESFASALKSQLSNNNVTKKTFANWMDQNVKAFAVDADSSETYFCLFDVKDMLNKISNNSTYNPGSSYITAVNTAFSNLVKYSVAQKGAGNAYGLGCIYSQGQSDATYIKQAYTSSETNFSNWLSFLKSYSYLG